MCAGGGQNWHASCYYRLSVDADPWQLVSMLRLSGDAGNYANIRPVCMCMQKSTECRAGAAFGHATYEYESDVFRTSSWVRSRFTDFVSTCWQPNLIIALTRKPTRPQHRPTDY